ncbi:MAG: hypothetical protein WAW61_18975 [Methylococcaceae bacterium]
MQTNDSNDAPPVVGTSYGPGLRKVRWVLKGIGKRGGVRVIYFNRLENGEIWLLIVYAKVKAISGEEYTQLAGLFVHFLRCKKGYIARYAPLFTP